MEVGNVNDSMATHDQDVSFSMDNDTIPLLVENPIIVLILLFVVGLRLHVRSASKTGLWWDDYLVLFAMIQLVGLIALECFWLRIWDPDATRESLFNTVTVLRVSMAYELLFITCVRTIQISAVVTYLRNYANGFIRHIACVFICANLCMTTVDLLGVAVVCRPFIAAYDPSVGSQCFGRFISDVTISAYDLFEWAAILLMPLFAIIPAWARMPHPRKVGIILSWIVGLMVIFVSIFRILRLATVNPAKAAETVDWPLLWWSLEPMIAMIASTWQHGAERGGAGRRDDSEAPLMPDPLFGRKRTAIAVQTKWSVSHHPA
ncbi:integral membrane protein [Colletotrichum sojae]|uniref:Integral membrane protein n=1 Tax=Colletotrichum sojae TaxID=2175907 RepID=A0A8H6IMP6_9PEZI|nr:integral membrane protein [Colletotrichum sojae]